MPRENVLNQSGLGYAPLGQAVDWWGGGRLVLCDYSGSARDCFFFEISRPDVRDDRS